MASMPGGTPGYYREIEKLFLEIRLSVLPFFKAESGSTSLPQLFDHKFHSASFQYQPASSAQASPLDNNIAKLRLLLVEWAPNLLLIERVTEYDEAGSTTVTCHIGYVPGNTVMTDNMSPRYLSYAIWKQTMDSTSLKITKVQIQEIPMPTDILRQKSIVASGTFRNALVKHCQEHTLVINKVKDMVRAFGFTKKEPEIETAIFKFYAKDKFKGNRFEVHSSEFVDVKALKKDWLKAAGKLWMSVAINEASYDVDGDNQEKVVGRLSIMRVDKCEEIWDATFWFQSIEIIDPKKEKEKKKELEKQAKKDKKSKKGSGSDSDTDKATSSTQDVGNPKLIHCVKAEFWRGPLRSNLNASNGTPVDALASPPLYRLQYYQSIYGKESGAELSSFVDQFFKPNYVSTVTTPTGTTTYNGSAEAHSRLKQAYDGSGSITFSSPITHYLPDLRQMQVEVKTIVNFRGSVETYNIVYKFDTVGHQCCSADWVRSDSSAPKKAASSSLASTSSSPGVILVSTKTATPFATPSPSSSPQPSRAASSPLARPGAKVVHAESEVMSQRAPAAAPTVWGGESASGTSSPTADIPPQRVNMGAMDTNMGTAMSDSASSGSSSGQKVFRMGLMDTLATDGPSSAPATQYGTQNATQLGPRTSGAIPSAWSSGTLNRSSGSMNRNSGPLSRSAVPISITIEPFQLWKPSNEDASWANQGTVNVELSNRPFANGAMREAYAAKVLGQEWVFKKYMNPKHNHILVDDVAMQQVCQLFVEAYNALSPPKAVAMLLAFVAFHQVSHAVYSVEPKLDPEEYTKYMNNAGAIATNRSTPLAFSHFTYIHSAGNLLITDLQGVGDMYTDPQIHSADGKGYGAGNRGMKGIQDFFATHVCNEICLHFGFNKTVPTGSAPSTSSSAYSTRFALTVANLAPLLEAAKSSASHDALRGSGSFSPASNPSPGAGSSTPPVARRVAVDDASGMDWLIKKCFTDVDEPNSAGQYCIHIAARDGHVAMLEWLISKGANVNSKDKNNRRAIHEAAANGNLSAVQVLVAAGADFSVADNTGSQSLHLAASNNEFAIVEWLISQGSNKQAKDRNGKTPAQVTTDDGIIQLLSRGDVAPSDLDDIMAQLDGPSS